MRNNRVQDDERLTDKEQGIYNTEVRTAQEEATRNEMDDLFTHGLNYFLCGYSKSPTYYNKNIAVAFALIGRHYGQTSTGKSNYSKGVAYIALRAHTNKRQVKSLRKKFNYHNGRVFRTPYSIPTILETMIELLREGEEDPFIVEFLKNWRNDLYRTCLLESQYVAIQTSATQADIQNLTVSPKVKNVYNKLNLIIDKV